MALLVLLFLIDIDASSVVFLISLPCAALLGAALGFWVGHFAVFRIVNNRKWGPEGYCGLMMGGTAACIAFFSLRFPPALVVVYFVAVFVAVSGAAFVLIRNKHITMQ